MTMPTTPIPEAPLPTIYVQPQTWQEQRECWRVMMCARDPELMREEAIYTREVTLETLKGKHEMERIQTRHQTEMEMQRLYDEERQRERSHELALREIEYKSKKLQYDQSQPSSRPFTRRRDRFWAHEEAQAAEELDVTTTDDDLDENNSNIGGGDPEDYCTQVD